MAQRKRLNRNKLFIFGGVVIIAVAVALVFVVKLPKHAGDIGFTAYRPVDSEKLTKTDEELILKKADSSDVDRFEYQIAYKDIDVVMHERKVGEYSSLACSDTGQDGSDYDEACTITTLKNGAELKVESAWYKGKLFEVVVVAHLKGTELYVSIPENESESFSTYDWKSYFSALHPVDLRGEPYQEYTAPINTI